MATKTKLYQPWFSSILVFALTSISYGLLIGAFDINFFGPKKTNNKEVMGSIVNIIKRYDVILIQEVLDRTEDSRNIMKALTTNGLTGFRHESSVKLGTPSYKEHYLFLIRENAGLSVDDRFQFNCSNVTFQRPPFSIKIQSKITDIKELQEFVLSAIHVKPRKGETEKEIGQLEEVHRTLKAKWKTDNIIIMGNMNAGVRFISKESLSNLTITKVPFLWLPKDTDTVIKSYCYRKAGKTKQARCPYDRFIITGADLKKYLDPNKTGIFEFDKEYKLTPQQTKAVSTHYPIELKLRAVNPTK